MNNLALKRQSNSYLNVNSLQTIAVTETCLQIAIFRHVHETVLRYRYNLKVFLQSKICLWEKLETS